MTPDFGPAELQALYERMGVLPHAVLGLPNADQVRTLLARDGGRDELAEMLQDRKLKPVTLEKAMKDPAYRLRDPYVGPEGIDWMERWSQDLHKDLPWDSWQDVPKPIEEEYDRNNKDRH